MDSYPFPQMASTTPSHHQHSTTTSTDELHSTNLDVRSSLRSLAATTWEEHTIDLQQSHRWLEGFFDNLKHAAQSRKDGQRPVMSELMKTPGRKRLATTTNHSNSNALTATNPALKDPVATLLFPSAPAFPTASSAHKGKGKENSTTTTRGENAPPSPNPSRGLLSPLVKAKSPFGSPLRSPMRTASPRPAAPKPVTPVVTAIEPVAIVQPEQVEEELAEEEEELVEEEEEEVVGAADLSNVMEEDEEEDLMDEAPAEPTRFSNASTVQEEQANLSIIGEEAEDEDDQPAPPVPTIPSPLPTPVSAIESQTSIILPETQFTADASSPAPAPAQPTSPTLLAPHPTGSPRSRVVSGASSIADEADADTAVPLNDAPSLLRTNSNPLSSSVPASAGAPSTTRTPGGGTARYGAGSFSAAKLGVGLGSSPPMTAGKGMRTSTGGARQLNFVGLPKKSLGLGLGLGRSWGGGAEGGSSQGSQSQGSTASQISTAPTTQPISSSAVGATTTTTSTGATKRKSLSTDEGPNKTSRTDAPQDANSIEEAASKAKRDALVSRMKNMQAGRQSAVAGAGFGGAGARMSGVNGQVGGMGAQTLTSSKPVSASSAPPAAPTVVSQPPQQPIVAAAIVSTVALPTPAPTPLEQTFSSTSSSVFPKPSAPTPAEPTSTTVPSLTRRPSVMDRIKSFEQSSSTDVRPPSPSKIPAATAYASAQAQRPTSPAPGAQAIKINPKSPRRLLSPTQRDQPSKIASPSPARAPLLSSTRIASPTATSTRMATRSSPAPAPAPPIQPKSPARQPAHQRLMQQQQGSTTPKFSPPPTGARGILQQLEDADTDQDEEEEEEEQSIRVVAPAPPHAQEREESEQTEQEGKRLVSLPQELEDEAMEDGDDEREEEVVVEKGRGALASAMDVPAAQLKPSASKTVMPGTFGAGASEEEEEEEEDDDEVEVISKPTTKPTLHKKGSQSSLASSNSSQSQSGGMFSSVFGGKASVKKTEPKALKSIQLAAAAARKEQAEKERKAAIKEEREQKRAEKKMEEDRLKAEEERKVRAEGAERKRKEREEQAVKSSKIVRPKAKIDEEPAKKRKVDSSLASSQSRSEIKKPQQLRPTNSVASHSYQSSTLNSSQNNRNPLATSQTRAGPSSSATTTPAGNLKTSQSSMIGVKFMAAPGGAPPGRVGAAGQQQKPFGSTSQSRPPAPQAVVAPAPQPRSEPEVYQELPDIDSEYSDSGDEGHDEKVKALPHWAQSPALAAALYRQQHVNPDDIFGPIPPLSMQEIFKTNTARFSKRTSSACWEGTDALTADDLARYNQAMGYTRASTSKQ